MTLSQEEFEKQWAENNLSVTDWFDTTYGLFKELEAIQSRSCDGCKYETQGRYRVPCDVCARTLYDEYTTKE